MSEPVSEPAPEVEALEALRRAGAERLDPLRFRYLQALAQRLQGQREPVRQLLAGRFATALAQYQEGLQQAQQAAGEEVASLSARHPELARELRRLLAAGDYPGLRRLGTQAAMGSPRAALAPLAQLNQHIRTATQGHAQEGLAGPAQDATEIRSASRFRETWAKIDAEQQVTQAAGRAPENAGPLNSHTLVLRSLELMRTLSPDYLRRFLSQVETLLWLEQAEPKRAAGAAKAGRSSRSKK